MATLTSNKKSSSGLFGSMANPVIRKLEKNAEYHDDSCASYGGIAGKTVYFLLVTVIGVLGYLAVHNVLMSSGAEIYRLAPDNEDVIYDIAMTGIDVVIVAVAALISIITPFLAWFIRPTIPVTGTLYAVSQGVIVGFITTALRSDLKWISLLAAVLTIMLVATMLFVYAKRIIKVTAKFRGIIFALFGTIVLAGILLFILNLIPFTRNLMTGINQIVASPAVSIIGSIVFIIIAALFMLADFDTIEKCVTNQLDKKYEWMAAWGLAYTILYVYFKILRLLLVIFGNKSSD